MSLIGQSDIDEISVASVLHKEANLRNVLRRLERQRVLSVVTIALFKALVESVLLNVDSDLGGQSEDRRLVGGLHLVVPGHVTLVDELLGLTLGLVITTELTRDDKLDFTRLSQATSLGEELRLSLRSGDTLFKIISDLEQIGHILTLEEDLGSLIHRDIGQTIRPVINDGVLFKVVLQERCNVVVDHSRDLIAGQERLLIHTLLVGTFVVSSLPSLSLISSPHLVGIRGDLASLSRITLQAVIASSGVARLGVIGDAVVSASGLRVGRNRQSVRTLLLHVLHGTGDDDLALGRAVDLNIGLHALAIGTKDLNATSVICILATDRDISGVHGIGNGHLRRVTVRVRSDVRVVEHVRSQNVLLLELATILAIHQVLDGVLGGHSPGLRLFTVSSVDGLFQVTLLGNMDIEPELLTLAGCRPRGPAKVSGSELRRLGVPMVGDLSLLGDRLVSLGTFVVQNDIGVQILIRALVIHARGVNHVVNRIGATSLGDMRVMVRRDVQTVGRRNIKSTRLVAVHRDTHGCHRVFTVIRSLLDTFVTQPCDPFLEPRRVPRLFKKTAIVNVITPIVHEIEEVLLTTSSFNVRILLVECIHDTDNTRLRIIITICARTITCVIQCLVTCGLNLRTHLGTLEVSLTQEPIDRVLTPTLR